MNAKQSLLSHIHNAWFGRQKRNSDLPPLFKLLTADRESGEEPRISHLDRKVLHGTRVSFVVLSIDMADFQIYDPPKTTTFHAPSSYRLDELLLKKQFNLRIRANNFLKPSSLGFMNKKVAHASDEGRSIRQLYLSNM